MLPIPAGTGAHRPGSVMSRSPAQPLEAASPVPKELTAFLLLLLPLPFPRSSCRFHLRSNSVCVPLNVRGFESKKGWLFFISSVHPTTAPEQAAQLCGFQMGFIRAAGEARAAAQAGLGVQLISLSRAFCLALLKSAPRSPRAFPLCAQEPGDCQK